MPSSSGSAAERRSLYSAWDDGGTLSAARAFRRDGDGKASLDVENSEKHSLISASVAAVILCSLANADLRGVLSLAGWEPPGLRFGP